MSHRPPEDVIDPISNSPFITVAIAQESAKLRAGTIRKGLLISGRLGTSVDSIHEKDLYASFSYPPRLTSNNPFLTAEQRSKLNADGLVRIGSIVEDGDVLVSILVANGSHQSQELPVVNGSWYVPRGWDKSRVVQLTREPTVGRRREFPKGVLERLTVRLNRQIPFSLTDQLTFEGLTFQATETVEDEQMPRNSSGAPADLIVSQAVAEALELNSGEIRTVRAQRDGIPAVDAIKARNVGHYSLISVSPLGGPTARRAGTLIRSHQLKWLLDRGYYHLVHEFVSLKYNDLQNREKLAQLARTGHLSNIVPAAPETLIEIREYLWGIGLAVEDHPGDRCVEISIRPAHDRDVLERTCGEVFKSETINYRTFRPEPGGLFCEKIFGAENSLVRRRRPGHIVLSEPIIPIIWRLGEDSVLSRLLDLPSDVIEKIVLRKDDVYLRSGQRQCKPHQELPDPELIAAGWVSIGTGADAIIHLCRQISHDQLPLSFRTRGCDFKLQTIPVIPPDFRPLVLLENGSFATADVNDLYRRVVNRNNRLKKLKELKAPEAIINNEISQLQSSVDSLQANAFLKKKHRIKGNSDRPLVCLLSLISGRITRNDLRRVDWGGEARAISDPAVPRDCVELPGMIYDVLFNSHIDRIDSIIATDTVDMSIAGSKQSAGGPHRQLLLTSANGHFLSRIARRTNQPLIHLHPEDAVKLRTETGVVEVHRPITDAAQDETRQIYLNESDLEPAPSSIDSKESADWFQHQDSSELIKGLIAAALTGQSIPMNSLRGICTLGTGPTTSQVVDTPTSIAKHTIPLHTKSEPRSLDMEAMIDVIERNRRRTCLVHVEQGQQEQPPHLGRIGGTPFLPQGTRWPTNDAGKPLIFIGQFPLDIFQRANLLPFEVSPSSLLSLFISDDWEQSCSTGGGSILVHRDRNLEEIEPPAEYQDAIPLHELHFEFRDVYPDLSTAIELVAWELDYPVAKVRENLAPIYEQRFMVPPPMTHFGGYPNWIQTPAEIDFVGQIDTRQIPELNIGDSGSLYIHGNSLQNLTGFIQSF